MGCSSDNSTGCLMRITIVTKTLMAGKIAVFHPSIQGPHFARKQGYLKIKSSCDQGIKYNLNFV